mgnify:CR=1 FL=1
MKGGRGRPRIYFELYWREARQVARSFGPATEKKPITSGLADVAMVPFYGFTMPEGFPSPSPPRAAAARLYLLPGPDLEKRRADGRFVSAAPGDVESQGGRKFVTLTKRQRGRPARGRHDLLPSTSPHRRRGPSSIRCRASPGSSSSSFLLFFSPTVWWILSGLKAQSWLIFNARNLNPVAVRLMVPKKEEQEERGT